MRLLQCHLGHLKVFDQIKSQTVFLTQGLPLHLVRLKASMCMYNKSVTSGLIAKKKYCIVPTRPHMARLYRGELPQRLLRPATGPDYHHPGGGGPPPQKIQQNRPIEMKRFTDTPAPHRTPGRGRGGQIRPGNPRRLCPKR